MVIVDLESEGPVLVPVCDSFEDERRLAWNLERLLGRKSLDQTLREWINARLGRQAA